MKKIMLVLFALGVSVLLAAQTQDTTKQDTTKQSSSSSMSTQTSDQGQASGQQMSGKVSADGKTFTGDNNRNYKVDNPDALQSVEGQHVAVIVHVDPDTGTVHILQIAAPQQ